MQQKSTQTSIGRRLKRWLAFKGWSIRTLADRSHVPYRTLQNYLGDERSPGAEQLAGLLRAGIDLNWLLGARPAGALTPGYELDESDAELVNADLELMRALHKKARELVDVCQLQHLKETGAPMPFERAFSLFGLLLLKLVEVAHNMASAIADLRGHGVETDKIAEVIASSFKSRLGEIAEKAAAVKPGDIDAALSPIFNMREEVPLA